MTLVYIKCNPELISGIITTLPQRLKNPLKTKTVKNDRILLVAFDCPLLIMAAVP
jgi:hypothetical protein